MAESKGVSALRTDLSLAVNPDKAAFFPRFFKSGPGEYGEGDQFLGVTVPAQRAIAKKYHQLSLEDVECLLASPWHEERLTALFILVDQFKRGDKSARKQIYDLYMQNTDRVNNWDLVDSSAGYIVGGYLEDKPEKMKVLLKLADSNMLWEKRISMIATFAYIMDGRAEEALTIAEKLVNDPHDLIQKAVGWMLREVGKRVDRDLLLNFLDKHAATMPRTTLRYAIEHLDIVSRRHYMTARTSG